MLGLMLVAGRQAHDLPGDGGRRHRPRGPPARGAESALTHRSAPVGRGGRVRPAVAGPGRPGPPARGGHRRGRAPARAVRLGRCRGAVTARGTTRRWTGRWPGRRTTSPPRWPSPPGRGRPSSRGRVGPPDPRLVRDRPPWSRQRRRRRRHHGSVLGWDGRQAGGRSTTTRPRSRLSGSRRPCRTTSPPTPPGWGRRMCAIAARSIRDLDRPARVAGRGRLWSHLVSDVSFAELHAFAETAGRTAAAGSTGTTTTCRRTRMPMAIWLGAAPARSREIVVRLAAAGLRRRRTGPSVGRHGS